MTKGGRDADVQGRGQAAAHLHTSDMPDVPDPPTATHFLAVDIETSGQFTDTNFVVEVGFALIDIRDSTVVATYDSYVAAPEGKGWERRCVDEFWRPLGQMFEYAKKRVAEAKPAKVVGKDIVEWIAENVVHPERTIVVTDEKGFDMKWLDTLLSDRTHMYLLSDKEGQPMYTNVLDVGSWYMGLGRNMSPGASSIDIARGVLAAVSPERYSSSTMSILDNLAASHTHRAGADATGIGLTASIIFDHVTNHLPG